jgi:hypothetical protein
MVRPEGRPELIRHALRCPAEAVTHAELTRSVGHDELDGYPAATATDSACLNEDRARQILVVAVELATNSKDPAVPDSVTGKADTQSWPYAQAQRPRALVRRLARESHTQAVVRCRRAWDLYSETARYGRGGRYWSEDAVGLAKGNDFCDLGPLRQRARYERAARTVPNDPSREMRATLRGKFSSADRRDGPVRRPK